MQTRASNSRALLSLPGQAIRDRHLAWYMFPVAIVIGSIAMASGVEGATFFAPIFILGLRLSPEIAIGSGLITEVFGFASGLTTYMRKRLIDYRLGGALIVVTIPMAVFGSWLGGRVDPDLLKVVLGMGLFVVALSFLRSPSAEYLAREDAAIANALGRPQSRWIFPTSTSQGSSRWGTTSTSCLRDSTITIQWHWRR